MRETNDYDLSRTATETAQNQARNKKKGTIPHKQSLSPHPAPFRPRHLPKVDSGGRALGRVRASLDRIHPDFKRTRNRPLSCRQVLLCTKLSFLTPSIRRLFFGLSDLHSRICSKLQKSRHSACKPIKNTSENYHVDSSAAWNILYISSLRRRPRTIITASRQGFL